MFWLKLIVWNSWTQHHHSCLIFNFCSFFINFQLNCLINTLECVSCEILIFYFLTHKLANLSLNIKINIRHLKMIDIFQWTYHFILIKVNSFYGLIAVVYLFIFYEINQISRFLTIYTDHKLIFIFVISVSYLIFLLFIICIKRMNFLAIKLKKLFWWFFEWDCKLYALHQVCIYNQI